MTEITQLRRETREKAEEYRKKGQYIKSAEWYSMAAFTDLAYGKPGKSAGYELRHFLEAATCYRIGGRLDRCKNRCQMGILRAEDIRERRMETPPPEYAPDHAERALWDEFIADLRTVGELDGAIEAYERAREIYQDAGDPTASFVDSHYTLNGVFRSIVRPAGLDVEEYDEVWEHGTCTDWSSYRRQHLPVAIDRLVENGEWPL